MSGGGKGKSSSQEVSVKLPPELKAAANKLLQKGEHVSQIGYQPNRAVTVAGFTPMQEQAFQNQANSMASFGMGAPTDAMAGIPKAKMSAGGISGYSTDAGYDEAMAGLPDWYKNQIDSMFYGPGDAAGGKLNTVSQALGGGSGGSGGFTPNGNAGSDIGRMLTGMGMNITPNSSGGHTAVKPGKGGGK